MSVRSRSKAASASSASARRSAPSQQAPASLVVQHPHDADDLCRDDPRPQVLGRRGELVHQHLGQRELPLVVHLPLACDERGARLHHPRELDAALAERRVAAPQRLAVVPARRVEHGLAGTAARDDAGQPRDDLVVPVEDQVLFEREVIGHGHLGDVRRPGHLDDRHLLEAALDEHPRRHGRDLLAHLPLLALPQPGFVAASSGLIRHGTTHGERIGGRRRGVRSEPLAANG